MAKRPARGGPKQIRLSGGEFGGRRLRAAPGVRPALAVLRESLFSMLGESIRGARILDLFAGSGSVGLEALGRGAAWCVFVDIAAASVAALRRNIATLGVEDRVDVIRGDARGVLRSGKLAAERFDLVFIGPPYDQGLCLPALEALDAALLADSDAVVAVQSSARETAPDRVGALERTRRRTYGDTVLHLYGLAEKGL